MSMQKRNTWVAVVDGREARFLLQKPNRNLELHHTLTAPPIRTNPDTRHSLGRSFESVGATRHIIEPHIDEHTQEKKLFVRDIAAYLEKSLMSHAFSSLILAAPPKILGYLRDALSAAVKETIIQEIGKDLTHFPPQEIQHHLEEVTPI